MFVLWCMSILAHSPSLLCPISTKYGGRRPISKKLRGNSGPTPVARGGGSGAKAPPLAARPVASHCLQKSHQL